MKITFNKAAYFVQLSSLEEAADVYENYINTYYTLTKEKRIPGGIQLFGEIDITKPITVQNNTVYDLKKCWGSKGKDKVSALLTMFGKMASGKSRPVPNKIIVLDEIQFEIPGDEEKTMLISLETDFKYTALRLDGKLKDGTPYEMLNISRPSHMKDHRIPLGIRVYQHNPKHKGKYVSMGNGEVASPMDLDDEEAQETLTTAIRIDKDRTLYAVRNGKCYVFPEHEPGKEIYHGYLEENPPDIVKKTLKI